METKQQDLTKVYNEMIALWMGVKNVWVHPKFGVYEAEDETGYIDWVDVGIRSLDYHRDWNKLMPVFKKLLNVLNLENWPTRDLKEWANAQRGRVERKFWEYAYDECTMPDLISEISDVIKWYTSNQPKSKKDNFMVP